MNPVGMFIVQRSLWSRVNSRHSFDVYESVQEEVFIQFERSKQGLARVLLGW